MSFAHTFSGGICIHCQAGWGSPAHVASPDECPVLRRATEALNARLAEVAPPARAAAAPQQHITSVLLNLASCGAAPAASPSAPAGGRVASATRWNSPPAMRCSTRPSLALTPERRRGPGFPGCPSEAPDVIYRNPSHPGECNAPGVCDGCDALECTAVPRCCEKPGKLRGGLIRGPQDTCPCPCHDQAATDGGPSS